MGGAAPVPPPGGSAVGPTPVAAADTQAAGEATQDAAPPASVPPTGNLPEPVDLPPPAPPPVGLFPAAPAAPVQPPLQVPPARRRDRWLWLWPVVAVVAMAWAGELFGPFGALLAGAAMIGTLAFLLGGNVFTDDIRLVVSVAIGGVILLVVYGHAQGWPAFTGHPAESAASQTSAAAPVSTQNVRAGARLPGADLDDLSMPFADLSGLTAEGAALRRATLDGADLTNATLRGADLQLAHLRRADLRGADLRGADLRGADLRDACLQGADLSGARLSGADAAGAATAGVVGAATVGVRNWPRPGQNASCG